MNIANAIHYMLYGSVLLCFLEQYKTTNFSMQFWLVKKRVQKPNLQ